MEYQEYIKCKKELYDVLLQFLECDNSEDSLNYQNFLAILENQHILNNRKELLLIFHLLNQIINNHHRTPYLLHKVQLIIRYIFKNTNISFTNLEIFSFFKSNKLIILFLIKNQIIFIDDEIVNEILHQSQKNNSNYHHFFYPEIKQFLNIYELENTKKELYKYDQNVLINFDEKRQIGENDYYICEMIRNDAIVKFISEVNRTNLSLSSTIIKPSIFETNSFLIKNSPSLIEYAAFYGSIQIFQYLKYNNVEMKPLLWVYAIHGQNAELIHILEENFIPLPQNSFEICAIESIKCHHNSFAKYFLDNYLNEFEIDYKIICKFYNFELFPNEIENNSIFYYICRYDYSEMINFYLYPKIKYIQDRMKITYEYFPFEIDSKILFVKFFINLRNNIY